MWSTKTSREGDMFAPILVAFWKHGICLVFVRPFKSYLVYAACLGGPQDHGTQHRTQANNKTGVCGWPVTWPPGAPVMAELDLQWHLSEKLLLQGSGVGVGWESDRMGWMGKCWRKTSQKPRGLSNWIGDFSFCNIEAALLTVDREKNNHITLLYVTLFFIQGAG